MMSLRPSLSRRTRRTWILQVAVLCFIGLHSIGLLHHHDTQAKYDACVVHQAVDHQILEEPGSTGAALLFVLVLFFVKLRRRPQTVHAAGFFLRPPTRAPPSPIASRSVTGV